MRNTRRPAPWGSRAAAERLRRALGRCADRTRAFRDLILEPLQNLPLASRLSCASRHPNQDADYRGWNQHDEFESDVCTHWSPLKTHCNLSSAITLWHSGISPTDVAWVNRHRSERETSFI